MKTAFLALLAGVLRMSAQTYTVEWFTIDGGGGTSTGGVYSVSGTLGQPDAGEPMTGGSYSLVGGFWSLPLAIQSAEAPVLRIEPHNIGQARIAWTASTSVFVLQETTNIATGPWITSPSGATNPVIVPATLPAKWYRLRKL